jgi:proline racemase
MRLTRMINAVDVIGGGLPGCVITGGVSDVPGKTMLDKAQ